MARGRLLLMFLLAAGALTCATCGQDTPPVGDTAPAGDTAPVAAKGNAEQEAESCVEPAQGPIAAPASAAPSAAGAGQARVVRMGVRPGDTAPDFEAAAYVDGGFKNIKLSDHKGKWVVLCFYPGDFTFA